MSILSDFEDRIADAVEGLFAGAFRSPVQPVELAKALGKAMDDGRAVGVGKVYAPASYTVALSREDTRNLGDFTDTLEGELSSYLVANAREQGYTLSSKPTVRFTVHNDLRLGRFRVSADLAPAEGAEPVADAPAPVAPGAPAPVAAPPAPRPPAPVPAAGGVATVSVDDHDVALHGEKLTIGRLKDCDICLQDANVSREHAQLVRTAEGWEIRDLDSTNGTIVNGHPVTAASLNDGDTIEVGASRLVYHGPRSRA
jgi:pSer/pThr/pTyr-binding forkhead associated (FHA) protein